MSSSMERWMCQDEWRVEHKVEMAGLEVRVAVMPLSVQHHYQGLASDRVVALSGQRQITMGEMARSRRWGNGAQIILALGIRRNSRPVQFMAINSACHFLVVLAALADEMLAAVVGEAHY
jgi:hypothetical protein